MRPNVVETVPKVLICEVGPRDGLQSVTATMPTRRVKKSQTSAATVRAPWGSGQGAWVVLTVRRCCPRWVERLGAVLAVVAVDTEALIWELAQMNFLTIWVLLQGQSR